ncbi:hypothetical protein [uncultured Desulfobulbus sp.]|uniref:hypothetical protein n=1 Tax=uncultured Desulfobulbus sp. TaxID=239745 RepID=UPI0029C90EAC|nr:hypothetical protein [uncultured Desulfobulbus sp.]
MSTSQPDPVLSVENPVSLIRSRIKEKRLFEARFLCRQLGDALGAKERLALERELTGLMDQVATLQHQARVFLDEGQKDQIVRLYNEIEAIAIDVPGLAEEKRALEGSEAIIAKLSSQTPHAGHRQHRLAAALASRNANTMAEQEVPIMPHIPPSDKEEQGVAVPAAGTHRKKRVGRRLWLAAGLVVLFLLLFFVWRGGKESPTPALSPTQATQKILIRPLVATSPETTEQPAVTTQPVQEEVKPVNQPIQPIEKNAPPAPVLRLGALQVEESQRR